jgi:hypothetical protein
MKGWRGYELQGQESEDKEKRCGAEAREISCSGNFEA